MKKSTTPKHLKFAVLASDIVLFTIKDDKLLVRLMKVNRPPYFVNVPGLPGGLIDPKETAEQAAARHLKAKAFIDKDGRVYMEQLYTFSEVKRDPRGRVVAVAYLALVPWESLSVSQQENTPETFWAPAEQAPKLAYDHSEVLAVALMRLRSRITYTTLMSKLMPKEFTLTELEKAYESIIHADLDKRNFRKKIFKLNILKKLPHKRSNKRSRPASLYAFKSASVIEIEML